MKKGLDYFPLDISFYRDYKIRKLIRRKSGQALTVYIVLLCKIYENGYYLPWDDEKSFILFEDTDIEEDIVIDIINYCVEVDLFDKQLFEQDHILTSRGVQERYLSACSMTKRKLSPDLPYLLVDFTYNNVKTKNTVVSEEKTLVFSEETDINSEETYKNTEESPQNKEKKNKDNNSLRSSLSPSSPAPSPAYVHVCEGRDGSDGEAITVEAAVELLKKDREWLIQMQRRHAISVPNVVAWLGSFVVECDCRGKQHHTSLSDVKQHFNDWLIRQRKGSSNGGSRKPVSEKMTDMQRWQRCHAEICKASSPQSERDIFSRILFEKFDDSLKKLTIIVPSSEIYERIEKEYIPFISPFIEKYFGKNLTLSYRVNSSGNG